MDRKASIITASDFFTTAKLLEEISTISSKNEKVRLLQENDSLVLREVLSASLDPYITYGVVNTKLDSSKASGNKLEDSWREIKHTLDLLQNRKLTGNNAKLGLFRLSQMLSLTESILLGKILKKDLRCRVAVKMANEAFPKLISEFNVMLAETKEKNIQYPCFVEPKLDGVRCLATVRNKEVLYQSRNGKVFENFGVFDNVLKRLKNGVYDGEVVGVDFNTLMTEAHRKHDVTNKKKTFVIFDFIPLEVFEKQQVYERKQVVRNLLLREDMKEVTGFSKGTQVVRVVHSTEVPNRERLMELYQMYLEQGYEGVVVKSRQGFYEFKRSKNWIKLKPEETIDVYVVGMVEGTGKYKGSLGALVVNVNGVNVNVGSGFSDKDRLILWQNKELIGKMVEVAYQERTPDGSLRFPVFKKWRGDKE